MNSVGNNDIAEYYAIILLSMIFALNFFFLSSLVYVFLGLKYNAGLIAGLLFLSLLIFFYFKFVYNDEYAMISKKYETETTRDKIVGNILTIGYIIGSIGLLIFGFFLMIQKNKGLI